MLCKKMFNVQTLNQNDFEQNVKRKRNIDAWCGFYLIQSSFSDRNITFQQTIFMLY